MGLKVPQTCQSVRVTATKIVIVLELWSASNEMVVKLSRAVLVLVFLTLTIAMNQMRSPPQLQHLHHPEWMEIVCVSLTLIGPWPESKVQQGTIALKTCRWMVYGTMHTVQDGWLSQKLDKTCRTLSAINATWASFQLGGPVDHQKKTTCWSTCSLANPTQDSETTIPKPRGGLVGALWVHPWCSVGKTERNKMPWKAS